MPVDDALEEARRLAAQRDEHRRARDFAKADALRDRIRELGYDVVDTPAGPDLRPAPEPPAGEAPALDLPARFAFSVHWLPQAWPEDVLRGIEAFHRHHPGGSIQHVVVETAGVPASWPDDVEVVVLDEDPGFARARNVGLRRGSGEIVVVVDGSLEPAGDVITPLVGALAEPSVGLAGPFGVVTDDLREFRESPGPLVDAIEGYLMAFRRETIAESGGFDERFRFYRAADLELSFRIRDRGLSAVVVNLPLARHEHRTWAATPPEERARLSKRNFYRFLDRWGDRQDLRVIGPERPPEPA